MRIAFSLVAAVLCLAIILGTQTDARQSCTSCSSGFCTIAQPIAQTKTTTGPCGPGCTCGADCPGVGCDCTRITKPATGAELPSLTAAATRTELIPFSDSDEPREPRFGAKCGSAKHVGHPLRRILTAPLRVAGHLLKGRKQ